MYDSAEPVLPRSLRDRLIGTGYGLRDNGLTSTELGATIWEIGGLPLDRVTRADVEIRNLITFIRTREGYEDSVFEGLIPRYFVAMPTLRFLFLFHGRGKVREAALAQFDEGLDNAFFVAVIACRLNDWVPQVRAAARACAARVFPKTAPEIVAEALLLLLDRTPHWERWKSETGNGAVIDATMARPDVVGRLAERLGHARTGPMGALLQRMLPWSGIDTLLPMLAVRACLPSVRAIAFRALIEGKGVWPTGYERQWVDKTYGISRRVPIFASRDIRRPQALDALVALAARDRSALVRRVAAEGLIRHRTTLSNLDTLVAMLAADRNVTVRERAAFIVKERAALAAPPHPR